MQVIILNTKKSDFANKNGEIVSFTTTTIAKECEGSENFQGYVIEEITGKASDYDIIKKYVRKQVNVDIDFTKIGRKNYKQKIIKVADITL